MTIGDRFPDVLAAAQGGAEWAWTELYRDLNPPLLRYLGAQARARAEDLASDTWLAAARGLTGFAGPEDAFRAWLFTIARRRVIEHWRHDGRRPEAPAALESLDWRAAPDDPAATATAVLSARQAAEAISGLLPPDQADVVLLRVVAGLDVAQVAQILGKRPGTVRVLQHKALRRLADRFSRQVLTP